MRRAQRCFLASGCSPRRQQRNVSEGSPPGEPIGHALVAVRHKRRRRAVTYREYALRALEARLGPPVPSADGSREPRSRREEEVDARASSTTSNAEIGHDPHRPEGLRRHGPVFFVAAPRRWRDIAVVAAPRIRNHGVRNGRRWGPRPGLWVENPTGHGTSPPSRRNPVRYAG